MYSRSGPFAVDSALRPPVLRLPVPHQPPCRRYRKAGLRRKPLRRAVPRGSREADWRIAGTDDAAARVRRSMSGADDATDDGENEG